MITTDTDAGIAVDYARVYKGTEDEPDEDGTQVVVTMTIGDDNDFVLDWTDGPYRAKTQVFIPLERLKKLIKAAD